jgi:hypothetical protein
MIRVRLLVASIIACASSLLAEGGPEAIRPPIGAPAWKDRRPIGRIFLSSSGWRTASNPSGYLNAKVDVISGEGRKRFREDLLAYADRCIANLKAMNAQGVVVWDLEGYEFPGMVYVGDPRKLPEFSPWMDEVADAFFAKFLKADLRTGLCIRPNHIFRIRPESVPKWGKWGYILYREPGIVPTNTNEAWLATLKGAEKDPVDELSDRIRYARRRWGCSLYYVDTNNHAVNDNGVEKGVSMSAAMFGRLAGLHPDVLLIPEHTTPEYYATTAPYGQIDMHRMTPPEIRSRYPGAFRLMVLDRNHPPALWDSLVQGVRDGDVLFCEAWEGPGSAGGATVAAICREAELRRQSTQTQVAGQGQAALALGYLDGITNSPSTNAVESLLKRAQADPEWVVRRAALRPLALAGRPEGDAFLAGLAADPTNDLGAHAAEALAAAGPRGLTLLEPVFANTNDSMREARYNAGLGLMGYDGPECLPLVHGLLRDKYSANRGLALALLKEKAIRFPEPSTFTALLEARDRPVNEAFRPRIDEIVNLLKSKGAVEPFDKQAHEAETKPDLP